MQQTNKKVQETSETATHALMDTVLSFWLGFYTVY